MQGTQISGCQPAAKEEEPCRQMSGRDAVLGRRGDVWAVQLGVHESWVPASRFQLGQRPFV